MPTSNKFIIVDNLNLFFRKNMRTLTNHELFAVSGGYSNFSCEVGEGESISLPSDFGDYSYGGPTFPSFSPPPSIFHQPMEFESGAIEPMNFVTPKGFVIGFIVEGVKAGIDALRKR